MKTCDLACHLGLNKNVFFHFREKQKFAKICFEKIFAKSFRFCEKNFFEKVFAKIFCLRESFRKIFCENENFCESFRLRVSFLEKVITKIGYLF
jgi:hypothetical protein